MIVCCAPSAMRRASANARAVARMRRTCIDPCGARLEAFRSKPGLHVPDLRCLQHFA